MIFPRFARRPGRRRTPVTWDRLRFYLLGVALLCLAFVVGFYLFFPTRALQEKVEREFYRQTGAALAIGRLQLTFPPGFAAENVRIPGLLPGGGIVDVNALRLRPLWFTLLGQSPGVDFSARLLGGEISGQARRNGPVAVHARQLAFAGPLAENSAIALAGVLGQGVFTGALPPQPTTASRFDFAFDRLQLDGLEAVGVADGTLALGRVVLRGDGRGDNFRIAQLEAAGGELLVTGSGSFMLGRPVERSRLNLNLALRPAPNLDPAVRSLLDLFATPAADGSYNLRISGTLATPVFAK